MATFKHISSKNADYGAAEQYLTFKHDEFTMKPTLDGNGRLVLRDDYRISSLNCGEEDFAIACMRSNLKYGKNQKREDVKSHHYIISFDPRDAPDNGLTVDRAQQLGEQFCREHFPGHQALVCTHPDGHNHSGNIHVHILNDLAASYKDRNEYIARLCSFPLLILDDFGMERGTEYGLEQVYNVIDSRYRSRKPLIVTTNLTLEELQNPEDTAHARIYDRLTEMCTPVRITGENFRKARAREKMEQLKTLLNRKESL